MRGTGRVGYWKDGGETNDNIEVIFEYPEGQKMLYSSILYNAYFAFMGDRETTTITIGKGMYFRESVAKVSTDPAKGS